MTALRRMLLWFFRRVALIYFREIEATGNVPPPDAAGRVFVANHVNGLVDPILVLTAAPCPISPVAKSTLWKVPVLRWMLDTAQAVPLVRRRDAPDKDSASNEAVFDRVAEWLAGGGNILIFPEGTSHNQPHLLEVKSGAARMLVRARHRGGDDVGFQAVALEFDARTVFRSRCLLIYGPLRKLRDLSEASGSDESLVDAITRQIREDLSELLVEGATWDERVLIARVAEMLSHDAGDRSLSAWSDVGRQVESARKALRDVDEASVQRIAAAVDRYYGLLAAEQLVDEQLAAGAPRWQPDTAWRLLLVLVALPIAALAVVLYWLPYQVPRLAAWKAANDPDEVSTYKLAAGLVVYPLWVAGLATAAFLLAPPVAAAVFTGVLLGAPFVALTFRDASRPLRRSWRAATRSRRLDELRVARKDAMALIQETRVRLGL